MVPILYAAVRGAVLSAVRRIVAGQRESTTWGNMAANPVFSCIATKPLVEGNKVGQPQFDWRARLRRSVMRSAWHDGEGMGMR